VIFAFKIVGLQKVQEVSLYRSAKYTENILQGKDSNTLSNISFRTQSH